MITIESIKEIITPLLKKHKINKAGLFGSWAKKTQHNDSDIDILVELNKDTSLFEFVRIKLDLEDQLQKKVDLVEYKALKSKLKHKILEEEIRIYG